MSSQIGGPVSLGTFPDSFLAEGSPQTCVLCSPGWTCSLHSVTCAFSPSTFLSRVFEVELVWLRQSTCTESQEGDSVAGPPGGPRSVNMLCPKGACFHTCKLPKDYLSSSNEPHSSTLAWKIPWTEEPGGLQSVGSLRVGHD